MIHVIHCYRLYKIMKSPDDSQSLKFSSAVADEYVNMAIAVRGTLDNL